MQEEARNNSDGLICGVMMPISAIDGCPANHWKKVKTILFKAIENARFTPQMVSDGKEVDIIPRRIIRNLFQNVIVVCDVSASNPNVMFELGVRVAFRKPTIIVKDDMTRFSFDISTIEQIEYPRDLQKSKISNFRSQLTDKIIHTYQASVTDPEYNDLISGFIKSESIEQTPVRRLDPKNGVDELTFLRAVFTDANAGDNFLTFVVPSYKISELDKIERAIKTKTGVLDVIPGESTNRPVFIVVIDENADREGITAYITDLLQ